MARPMSYGAGEFIEDLQVLSAHLHGDEPTVEIATTVVDPVLEVIKERHVVAEEKGHALIQVQDLILRTDEEMDNAVRTTRDVVLDDVGHDRRDAKFVRMFARGVTAITRIPIADEILAVRVLADQCAKDSSPKVQERATVLNEVADRMSAAQTQRQNALIAESAAHAQVQVSKSDANDAIERARRDLMNQFPHDRARVRSYFRAVSHTKSNGSSKSDAALSGNAPPAAA